MITEEKQEGKTVWEKIIVRGWRRKRFVGLFYGYCEGYLFVASVGVKMTVTV